MHRDRIGDRHIVGNDTVFTRTGHHGHPAKRDLGRVHIAGTIKGNVIRRGDWPIDGADNLQRATVDIERRDGASGHLCHINPPVRPGAQTIGTEQPAGRRRPVDPPSFRRLGARWSPIATGDHQPCPRMDFSSR